MADDSGTVYPIDRKIYDSYSPLRHRLWTRRLHRPVD